jgi:hypothetical protein
MKKLGILTYDGSSLIDKNYISRQELNVKHFVNSCLEIVDGERTKAKKLYQAYTKFSKSNNLTTVSKAIFYMYLSRYFYEAGNAAESATKWGKYGATGTFCDIIIKEGY